ncbi:MAG: hypothetical protein CMJ58_27525 [Planctomycetaceae bacterium]|nr:hypothetical protein [Planctomycetaceae bacterium]
MRFLAGFAVVLAWTAVASGQIVDVSWVGGAGTEFWSDDANWSPAGGADFLNARVHVGNRVPDAVTVVDNQYTLWALNITNGAEIHTDIWNLQVWNETTLSDAGSAMFVSDYFAGGSADSLVTDTLTVNDGAAVYIESDVPADWNFVHIWVNDLLDVNAGGTLQGFGRVVLDSRPLAEPTTMLDNNGLIRAYKAPEPGHSVPEPGSLIITSTDPDARVDLDGPGAVFGRLQVNANQVLDIQVPLADAFGGTIDLHTGARFRVEDPWELNGDAVVNVNTREIGTSSTPGDAATITGAAWTMTGGTINVDDRWDSLQFGSRCTATGGTINNSGALIFNAQVAIQEGVDFNMNGSAASLVVKPDKTVTINTPDFDLDGGAIPGFDNSAATTIEAGGILNLNLGAGADMQFNHTINLNGGELNVANSEQSHWTLAFGAINAAGGATSRINDAGVAAKIFSGRVHVTEDSTLFIHAPSEFDALANVVVDAGSTLDVGQATYSGGAYSGGGTFGKGSATIAAPTTWNVACVDLDDGPTTINADLTINADRLEEGTDGVDATHSINKDARLTVNVTDGQWTLDDGGAILYNGDSALHAYLAGSECSSTAFLETSATAASTRGSRSARRAW